MYVLWFDCAPGYLRLIEITFWHVCILHIPTHHVRSRPGRVGLSITLAEWVGRVDYAARRHRLFPPTSTRPTSHQRRGWGAYEYQSPTTNLSLPSRNLSTWRRGNTLGKSPFIPPRPKSLPSFLSGEHLPKSLQGLPFTLSRTFFRLNKKLIQDPRPQPDQLEQCRAIIKMGPAEWRERRRVHSRASSRMLA